MPPARRRGVHKAKANEHLSLGDLVLAKVKGFPFWPAKISRPEDWGKPPDPKKHFVQFFGTKEIAFVTPADIQAFTNETKTKLSARCQGKTKCFTKAVKEICAAFDELEKQKASGLRDDTDDSRIGSEAPSVDGLVGDQKDAINAVVSNVEKAKTNMGDVVSNVEHCTQRCGRNDSQDEKLSVSGHPTDSSSPVLSPVLKSKSSNGAELNKHTSKSGLKDQSCLKVEVSDFEDVCNFNDFKKADNVQNVPTNGMKPKKPVTGLRERSKAADDRKRSGGFNRAVLKDEYADLSRSGEILKGGKKGKNASSVESDSPDSFKSDSDINSGNKDRNMLKVKTSLKEADRKNSLKQKKTQVQRKRNLGTSETLGATKKLKCMDTKDNSSIKSIPEDVNGTSPSSPVVDDKAFKRIELKRSASCLKTEEGLPSRGQISIVGSDDVCEVLNGAKHHSQLQLDMPHSASFASGEHTEMSSLRLKGDANNLTIKQAQRRHRTVCLFDYDDDEPKTPVHGGAAKNIKSPSFVSVVTKSSDACLENGDVAQMANREHSALRDNHLKEPFTELLNDTLSTGHPQKEKDEEDIPVQLPHNPEKLDSQQFPSQVEKLSSISPVNSPGFVPTTKSNAEQHKSSKPLPKVSSNSTQKKANGSSKSLNSSSSSHSQVATHKTKLASSVERSKTISKTLPQAVEVPATKENLKELDVSHVDRLEVGMEEKSSIYTGSRTPETAKTMKHLIAAAQAKRRLVAQFQCHPLGLNNAQEGTPSPSTAQPFLSVPSNFGQADPQGVYEQLTLASPSTNGHHSTSQNQLDAEENEEKRASSVQRTVGDSLSGGTEAAVARDAFEGMIETLSRTKESIGRATRLAIDCAKYGIANEVVELLIRKLESETSFHRKVDLFFLVDSITQCSHNHKGGRMYFIKCCSVAFIASASLIFAQICKPQVLSGIAGASYIPAVQGGLPRLLGAAAPPGSSARENRRQCLKVLRLWLERKIFPESVLRRYMDDIGVSNDDMAVSFSFRRPSRAERSVDDPIREMEGMLVDEYGSNATFQLPGFLSARVFEEDEDGDFPNNLSPADPTHTHVDSDTSTITPSDKRHCILEDVDGELEMEDVSAQASLFSQALMPCQSSHQSSPLSGNQMPHDYSGTTSGNQIVQIAGNSFPGGHNNTVVKNERLPQPSACFPPMAGCSSQEPSAFNPPRQLEYGQNDMYLNSQVLQPNQQFQLGNPPFAPRHVHPTAPQNPSNNQYSYPKPTVQQHLPHSFNPPFSSPSLPDGQRQFVANEQWRMSSSEFKANSQQGLWRGINPSYSVPPFGQEVMVMTGYFWPPLERPPMNNVGFQHANPSNTPAPPMSGYGVPQMFPCRPDIPALNCWRPT
ncbi:PWWP domain [Sesbania bispinosa]|nr:PWWP domain [Sesbania bispinosa]